MVNMMMCLLMMSAFVSTLIRWDGIVQTLYRHQRRHKWFFPFLISGQYNVYHILCFECRTVVLCISLTCPFFCACFYVFNLQFSFLFPGFMFSSNSFLPGSIHCPCWLSVPFLLSKSFQSLLFMALKGINKG